MKTRKGRTVRQNKFFKFNGDPIDYLKHMSGATAQILGEQWPNTEEMPLTTKEQNELLINKLDLYKNTIEQYVDRLSKSVTVKSVRNELKKVLDEVENVNIRFYYIKSNKCNCSELVVVDSFIYCPGDYRCYSSTC